MQRIQRKFGKMLPRSADESQVAALLKDFEDVDNMLERLIAAAKAWRDAWKAILLRQQRIATEFDGLYQPILATGGSGVYNGPEPVMTPDYMTGRTSKLSIGYTELETDMKEEVDEMDFRVIRPAEEAKNSIQPLKKVIKKRNDRKLDYERYQNRYDGSVKKIGRSDRENRAMYKHEGDLAKAKEEYAAADASIRENLPALLQAVFSMLPYILAAQIHIQNNLLGHCYTQISEFCTEEVFPNPAPGFETIVEEWQTDFVPAKDNLESLQMLRKGKAVHQPMNLESQNAQPQAGTRRPSGQSVSPSRRGISPAPSDGSAHTPRSTAPPSPNMANKPSLDRVTSNSSYRSDQSYNPDPQRLNVPSQTSLGLSMPNYRPNSARSPGSTTPDNLNAMAPAGPNADYFSRDRTSSNSYMSPTSSIVTPGSSPGTGSLKDVAAAKKRPPPPPPKKKPGLGATYVTALYDFSGQSNGDLTFREGDKIKVIKKTESQQDWWEGELAGVRGHFPANYCQVA